MCFAKLVLKMVTPCLSAKKYSQSPCAGFSAASMVFSPGEPIGPGGRPVFWYVLYSDGLARSSGVVQTSPSR